jgi:LmbE family N-acetylglucosaminyl deacetylase
MLRLQLPNQRSNYQILCVGAHSDDIEIGCGGAILKLINEYKTLTIHWIVFSAEPERKREALKSARLFLKETVTENPSVEDFRASFFPDQYAQIKEAFERIKGKTSPDLIFTHCRHDLHQDHRVINELTWNTFRDHFILEYEIPKYDGDLGNPNFYIQLDESLCARKIQYIFQCFKTQQTKHWFTEDTFRALLRLRGIESGASAKYAEAFYARKIAL